MVSAISRMGRRVHRGLNDYAQKQSGTLLEVRLVGASLVIGQVNLGMEGTIAIHGNQVSLRRVQVNE